MLIGKLKFVLLLTVALGPEAVASEWSVRVGYKFNEYPQDRLRFIPTVESTPAIPDFSRVMQHSFYSELEYRFRKSLSDHISVNGLFFAQSHFGKINPVGLQTNDTAVNFSSYEKDYYIGASFLEGYLSYDLTNCSVDVGFINPVYGHSSIAIADVFAKSRQIASMRKSEDAATELRQGNLGFRFSKLINDDELTLIYMPELPNLHEFSNFGHRAYVRYQREYPIGSIAAFALYQTRDNYDGPYTAILDVNCTDCIEFDVPRLRETNNFSIGIQFDAGLSDALTIYGEALLSSKTSKFLVTQIRPITGLDQEADANSVTYRRANKKPYLKFMLGEQYSFTSTDLVRLEYIHDMNGYSKSERYEWLRLLDESLKLPSYQLYGDLRDFIHNFGTFSKNYVFWNFEKRMGTLADNVLSVGQYASLDDQTTLTFAGYSHAISNSTSLNVRGTYSSGGQITDFGSLGERSSLSIFTEISF